MQKPHVLQWLALGGLHMLHVEQYLGQQQALQDRLQVETGMKNQKVLLCW